MKYMLLIIEPTGQRATRTEAEGRAAYAAMQRFGESLQARGKLLAVESLASQRSGVLVQTGAGRERLIDGPFAEAKEMIGGFYLVDCASLDEAVAIARECPAAGWASVEVRPVAPCFDDSRATVRDEARETT